MTEEKKITNQDIYEMAVILRGQYLEQYRGFRTITLADTKEIFQWNQETGLFEEKENEIRAIIEQNWQDLATCHNVNECIEHLRRLTIKKREEIEQKNKNLIPLQNGLFDLEKDRLIPYTAEYFFTFKHPIEYNSLKECPKIQSFLNQVTEKDASKQEILLRTIGYCFYRGYPIQKAIMLIGSGANGKSVYLNLIRSALGQEAVSSTPLQELTEDRFAPGRLYGKNANIFADLETKALKSTGKFKALTGGDYLTCDRKFKESFDFLNHAKLLFSCNQMPAKADESDAFYRRWVIIEFTRTFLPEEQNPTLLCELTEPEELSGLFNLAKNALSRTLKENRLDFSTIEETRERYAKNSDSAKAFCYDRLELSPENYIGKPEMYSTYIQYCKAEKIPVKTEKAFFRSIYLFFEGQVYEFRPRLLDSEGRVRAMRGICFKQEEDKETTAKSPGSP